MFFVCLPEGKIEMAIAILLWQKMYIKYIHILLGCRPVHHLKISQVSWESHIVGLSTSTSSQDISSLMGKYGKSYANIVGCSVSTSFRIVGMTVA